MKPPIIKYTKNQEKLFALLREKPRSRKELLEDFAVSQNELTAILRTPLVSGKIDCNNGKYELYKPPASGGLTVTRTRPQPYSPPRKFEFMYLEGKLPKDY